jgi:hypothetical protein
MVEDEARTELAAALHCLVCGDMFEGMGVLAARRARGGGVIPHRRDTL